MSHILTFDLGTTYFKVCLFDKIGQLLAVQRVTPPIARSDEGRCELSAEGFCRVLTEAVLKLGHDVSGGLSGVAAISFATQANSFVLLDDRDQPLTPFIMWPDNRACPTEPLIDGLSQRDDFCLTTGIPQMSCQFLPAKLFWVKKHEPKIWSQTKRLCLISDYLTLWMTGQHITEAGAAGLTGLVDIHQLQWWPEACRHLSIPDTWSLNHITRAGTEAGEIRQEIAKALGLPSGCRFVVGCLDQYAGAIGAGNVTSEGVSETTGTVLATVRCADQFNPNVAAGVFQGPGHNEHTWYQMVFGDTSANLLEAFRNSLPDRPEYEALLAPVAEIPPGCDGLCIVTSNIDHPESMFSGQTKQHAIGHQVRAILEAVAYALEEQINLLCRDDRPTHIRSVGGAARSEIWLQIKSDVLGLLVQATTCPEPTSLGAAILAASSLQQTDIATTAKNFVQACSAIQPDVESYRYYKSRLSG